MARGWPAFWTTLIALPFLLGGAYVYLHLPQYPTSTGTLPMLFAGFMILLGLYVHVLVAPAPPEMQPGEKLHIAVSPFSMASINLFSIFLFFLTVTIYLRFKTGFPVLLPAASMVVCLYFLVVGLARYWKSSLRVHYVTNRRIITDYRFLWLIRVEVPLDGVSGLEQRKTIMESLLGIGNIVLVTGAGGRRPARIEMYDIRNAMTVRKQIAALRFAHTGEVDDPADLEDGSLLDPIIDVPSNIEEAVTAMIGRDDTDTDTAAGEVTVDESRTYDVGPDLNLSLSADLDGAVGAVAGKTLSNGDDSDADHSNADVASILVKGAAMQAASLGQATMLPLPNVVLSQLVTGSKNAAAVVELLADELDDTEAAVSTEEVDSAGRTAQLIRKKLKP